MIPRYRVFKGPGNRLVAIGLEVVRGCWQLKTGEQGKRLRSSEIPADRYASRRQVETEHVPDGYDLIYEGKIDVHGNPVETAADVLYWEARAVDISSLMDQIRQYAVSMREFDVPFQFIDDMSGTRVRFGHTDFGVSRALAPGTIDVDGSGGGALSLTASADLLCLIALLSREVSIVLVDIDGNPVTCRQVVNRAGPAVSGPMTAFLQSHGFSSLATALRNLNPNQVRF